MQAASIGALAGRKGTYVPSYTDSFDNVVSHYNVVKDYIFGTGVVAAPGQTKIGDLTDLAVNFQPLSANAGDAVINREYQRYPAAFNSTNHAFSADSFDATAVLQNASSYSVLTKTPSANVAYNKTVSFANTADVGIGQIVGFGSEQYDNLHKTNIFRVVGTPAEGDTMTLGLSVVGTYPAMSPVTIVTTAGAGASISTMADDVVAQINANTTLAANKIIAALIADSPGCYTITYPRLSSTLPPDEFGRDGKGSTEWLSISTNKSSTGITAFQLYQTVYFTYVVAKTDTTLTFNHPVTVTTLSTLTLSPCYCFHCSVDSFNVATLPVSDTSNVTIGMAPQVSYQDNSVRRVISKTASTVTLNANVFVGAGLLITFQNMYSAVSNTATTASNVLGFAAVPEGVREGMEVVDIFAGGVNGTLTVISKTETTVTVSRNVTFGSGTTFLFYPQITSGQIWSKWRMMPSDPLNPGRDIIAMEATVKAPNAAAFAAWPAWWMFTDTSDPDPGAGSGSSEIDMMDMFTYYNNGSTNNYIGTNSSPSTDLYLHPDWGSGLTGNNMGLKERTIGLVWKANRVYYYLDKVLIRVTSLSWNQFKRAQFAFSLAIGSYQTSFYSNGFYPLDYSQFPIKYSIKRWKIWFGPTDETFEILS